MSPIPDILKELNPQQQRAAAHLNGPALVVAGPGSGKTRVLTHRVANLIQNHNISPFQILAITFTNKASGEMKERIFELLGSKQSRPAVGTFHSMCARWLRVDGMQTGLDRNFIIYDESDSEQALKQVIKTLNLPEKFTPSSAKYAISSAKNALVSAADYPKYAHGFFQEQVAKVYPLYQKLLVQNHALDFDDLLFYMVDLLVEQPKILKKYQEKYSHILIDEYQDTNQAQYILSKLLAQAHQNLFVVGDVAQAIYSWRGADYRNLNNLKKDFPKLITYELEQNYRSTVSIISAAKEVIKNNRHHLKLNLWTSNPQGEKVTLYTAADEKDEAGYIIKQLEKDNDWNAAVLYRTNAQSRALEETFMRAGVPYRLVGGLKFYERQEIKDILAYLTLLINPNDSVAKERILGIGKRRAVKFEQELALGRNNFNDNSPLELIDEVVRAVDYFNYLDKGTPESQTKIENVKELRSVATNFDNLGDFLENVALVQDTHFPSQDAPPNHNEVILTTLHSAKGLEFNHVFIVGMEESLLPHSRSLSNPDQLEEERRLCYVGMTRAKKRLHLTHAFKRLYFGSIQCNLISRFASEIPRELLEERSDYHPTNNSLTESNSSNLGNDDPISQILSRDYWGLE